MQAINHSITINAPVSKVRDTMLNHPTYEQRTNVFAPGSTYEWSRDQWASIKFIEPNSGCGMFAQIAANKLHEFVSIQHLWEIIQNEETGQKEEKVYDHVSHENYTFTTVEWGTQVDVVLDSIPDQRVEYMNEARPKALQVLKEICEK